MTRRPDLVTPDGRPSITQPSSLVADLSLDECRAWAERYATTPFNMLALSTSANGDPGPMVVMRSLFKLTAELEAARAENCRLYREATVTLAEVVKERDELSAYWKGVDG